MGSRMTNTRKAFIKVEATLEGFESSLQVVYTFRGRGERSVVVIHYYHTVAST